MRALFIAMFLSTGLVFVGCGGGGDEVLDYDPEVSKQKSAEYEQQMKEAMQNQGPPGRNR
ncbi:MAG: hypothetical protein ACF8TS_04205 [Maioricimonas sp. JB049]